MESVSLKSSLSRLAKVASDIIAVANRYRFAGSESNQQPIAINFKRLANFIGTDF